MLTGNQGVARTVESVEKQPDPKIEATVATLSPSSIRVEKRCSKLLTGSCLAYRVKVRYEISPSVATRADSPRLAAPRGFQQARSRRENGCTGARTNCGKISVKVRAQPGAAKLGHPVIRTHHAGVLCHALPLAAPRSSPRWVRRGKRPTACASSSPPASTWCESTPPTVRPRSAPD